MPEEERISKTFTVEIPKKLSEFIEDFARWVGVPPDRVLEDLLTSDILKPFLEDNDFITYWIDQAWENRIDKIVNKPIPMSSGLHPPYKKIQ